LCKLRGGAAIQEGPDQKESCDVREEGQVDGALWGRGGIESREEKRAQMFG
jgi:hypothetical protein